MKWKKYVFNTPAQDIPSAAAPAEKAAASITRSGKKNWSTTSADRKMVLYCLRRWGANVGRFPNR